MKAIRKSHWARPRRPSLRPSSYLPPLRRLSHSYHVRPAYPLPRPACYKNNGPARMARSVSTLKGSVPDTANRSGPTRWLWAEREKRAAHNVQFDMPMLRRVAADAIGSQHCVKTMKITEGDSNKVFLMTMDDAREVIVKLPDPSAGRPHFTTASEVATMNFLRDVLHLPIPHIYASNSRLESNPVGAEYIIMEKQSGVQLDDVWDKMDGAQKAQLVEQVVELEKVLASVTFTKYGSLYYKKDLPQPHSTTPLYRDINGNDEYSNEFEMGPTNDRFFAEFGKGALDIDRGPWSTIEEYVAAIARREIACVEKGLRSNSMPEGLFYGPRQYQPSPSKKISALNNYLKVARYVLPKNQVTRASILWHGRLHGQNIFVDPKDPTRIQGIINWQSVSASPLYMQVAVPRFLDFYSPDTLDLSSSNEQEEVAESFQFQNLHDLYMARLNQRNPAVFLAMEQKISLRHHVTLASGEVFMHFEPCLNHLLRLVEQEWPNIIGTGPDRLPLVPCPLRITLAEIQEQERDENLWAQGIDLMNTFVRDTGVFKYWDGRVSNDRYQSWKEEFEDGVERFLVREARNVEERAAWLKALPFVDDE